MVPQTTRLSCSNVAIFADLDKAQSDLIKGGFNFISDLAFMADQASHPATSSLAAVRQEFRVRLPPFECDKSEPPVFSWLFGQAQS